MYGEHPDGGMTEINSHKVDFLEDEFPTIGEIKKDVELFELQIDIQPPFGERENLDSNQVIEHGMPPLSERNGRNLSTQENEICHQSPIHKESQPVSEVCPQSPVHEYAVSPHVQDPTP